MTEKKKKIAVLGGGCGAVTAAFVLSKPEFRDLYDITVYNTSHRLGGKGASGRNAEAGQRIQEHGLHMWMGFYVSAFHYMCECFAEWEKPAGMTEDFPFALFEKQPSISMEMWAPRTHGPVLPGGEGADWSDFTLKDKGNERQPWVPNMFNFTLENLLHFMSEWIKGRVHAIDLDHHGHSLLKDHTVKLVDAIMRPLHEKRYEVALEVIDGIQKIQKGLFWIGLIDRNIEVMLDAAIAATRGLIKDVLVAGNGDLESINHLDFREWLELNGAEPSYLPHAPVKTLYDLGFAYTDGNSTNPASAKAAAGVALRVCMLMILDSRGALLWRMRAGMGDTIFSPFYDVLKARGVKFEFFNRVTGFAAVKQGDSNVIDEISVTRKVRIKGDVEYDPKLFDLNGFRCWHQDPDWTQIEDGDAIRDELAQKQLDIESYWCTMDRGGQTVLKRGTDFDEVVCAIPIGELKMIARNLGEFDSRWTSMLEGVITVPTQSIQLWLRNTLEDLGWKEGPTVSVGYEEPFDSWGEMSHLLPREEWGPWGDEGPKAIEYFCGALVGGPEHELPPATDYAYPQSQYEAVRANAQKWITSWLHNLLPKSVDPVTGAGFDWDQLFDVTGKLKGIDKLDAQFLRANVDPSERYVLSVPGSTKYRLDPADTGFANMTISGDWVRTSMNSGCVEAAFEGGLRGAAAVLSRDGLKLPPPLTCPPATPQHQDQQ